MPAVGHPREVVVRPGRVVAVVAGRDRQERPVGDAADPELLVADVEEAPGDTRTQPSPGRGSGPRPDDARASGSRRGGRRRAATATATAVVSCSVHHQAP